MAGGGRVTIYIPTQSFCIFTVKVERRWPQIVRILVLSENVRGLPLGLS